MNDDSTYNNKFEEMSDAVFDDSAMADEFLEELPESDIESAAIVTTEESITEPVITAEPSQDEKSWFLLAHLSALSSFIIPFGSILGPLIVWQAKKEQYPSVVPHAKAALNFQLSVMIYMLLCIPLVFIVIGVFGLIALGIGSIIFTIMNAIKAQNGEPYKYPFSMNLIK